MAGTSGQGRGTESVRVFLSRADSGMPLACELA